MQRQDTDISRAWFAICWFTIWGLFQGFAVVSVLNGTWERPEAFPAGAYESLIYPDMFFVPLYLLTAVLLLMRHWLGSVLAFVAGGGIVYVMIYLLALSGFSGTVNLMADGTFLACTFVSLWQVAYRVSLRREHYDAANNRRVSVSFYER
jgi:hypothetical protein